MYQFRPVSERMKIMHERIRERVFHVDSERSLIVTKASQQYEHIVPTIKNALVFRAMCQEQTTRVEDHEILVANNTKYFCGTQINPRWGGGDMYVAMAEQGIWTMGEDGYYHNPETDELRLVMSPEDMANLKSVSDYWKGRTVGDLANSWQPEGYDELDRLGVRSFGAHMPILMMPAGHSTPGYGKILSTGYAALKKQARDWLDAHRNNLMGEDLNRSLFYSAVEITCEGAITLLKRYGQACYEKAEACEDPARKAELKVMGDNLMWISENPAQTYWQACQATLLYEMM
ncbi:MAG: pyruvate formate lyase family protein, partial [Oscillospiraceae bacterium]|nr:pyruvate formate lyase family protein [Oscillospiraceae bacterium]